MTLVWYKRNHGRLYSGEPVDFLKHVKFESDSAVRLAKRDLMINGGFWNQAYLILDDII